jgi:hypothetical protein
MTTADHRTKQAMLSMIFTVVFLFSQYAHSYTPLELISAKRFTEARNAVSNDYFEHLETPTTNTLSQYVIYCNSIIYSNPQRHFQNALKIHDEFGDTVEIRMYLLESSIASGNFEYDYLSFFIENELPSYLLIRPFFLYSRMILENEKLPNVLVSSEGISDFSVFFSDKLRISAYPSGTQKQAMDMLLKSIEYVKQNKPLFNSFESEIHSYYHEYMKKMNFKIQDETSTVLNEIKKYYEFQKLIEVLIWRYMNPDPIVWITLSGYGEKYHRHHCHSLDNSRRIKGLKATDAWVQGYERCNICQPPLPVPIPLNMTRYYFNGELYDLTSN